ncbi:hypothetical protein K0L52_003257 [Vibrio fluvialis]|nr:hypothetical protein [Vibrio fluvialis]
MNREERIAAAKKRMLSRYPDRDTAEASRMESFRGLSKDELKRRFEEAAKKRGIELQKEQAKRSAELEHQ